MRTFWQTLNLNRQILIPVSYTFILAAATYTLIPHVFAAREAARLTICNNQLWTCCAGYCAHTVIVGDEFAIVRVESDPLWNGGVEDRFLYEFLCEEHNSGDLTRLPIEDIPNLVFEEAHRKVSELRSSREFLYRQGRTPAQGMAVE